MRDRYYNPSLCVGGGGIPELPLHKVTKHLEVLRVIIAKNKIYHFLTLTLILYDYIIFARFYQYQIANLTNG